MFFASSKSNEVSPPRSWVVNVSVTLLHEFSMSGWWFIASASSPTLLMNARASRKPRNFHERAMAFPVRVQPGTSASRAAISSSVSSVLRAMDAQRMAGGAKRFAVQSAHDDEGRLCDEVRRPRDVESDSQEVAVVRVCPLVARLDVRGNRHLERERLTDPDRLHGNLELRNRCRRRLLCPLCAGPLPADEPDVHPPHPVLPESEQRDPTADELPREEPVPIQL